MAWAGASVDGAEASSVVGFFLGCNFFLAISTSFFNNISNNLKACGFDIFTIFDKHVTSVASSTCGVSGGSS